MNLIERLFGQRPQIKETKRQPLVADGGIEVMHRLSQNMAQAAQRMTKDGLQVDLDDLGWEADRRYEDFLSQDPDKLRLAAKVLKENGMLIGGEEEYQEILADADFIEVEQKRRQNT